MGIGIGTHFKIFFLENKIRTMASVRMVCQSTVRLVPCLYWYQRFTSLDSRRARPSL